MRYPLKYIMITEGLPMNGDSLKHGSMGGSETAFIQLAKEIASHGNTVDVYCKCDKPGVYDGVIYRDIADVEAARRFDECDVLIVSRFAQYLGKPWNSKVNVLWTHDILTEQGKGILMASAWNIDWIYCLSDYHKQQYVEVVPELSAHIKLFANAIDWDIVNETNNRQHKIMFTSRPERGLFNALKIYHSIGDKSLEFLVCNYKTLDVPEVKRAESACQQLIDAMKDEGYNIRVDRFNKEDLYKEISQSKAVLYSTNFPEVFCISAVEAQANGTAFVCTDGYALKETVIDETRATTWEDMADILRDVIADPDKHRAKARAHVHKYRWNNMYKMLSYDLFDYVTERSKNKAAIMQALIYEGSLIVAKEYGDKNGLDTSHVDRLLESATDAAIYENANTYARPDEEVADHARVRAVIQHMGEATPKTILDYGCHTGAITRAIASAYADAKVFGYDISARAIKQAKTIPADNVSFSNYETSIKAEYDVVFMGEVLEHVVDYRSLLQSLEKRAKKRVVLTLPRGGWEYIDRHSAHDMGIAYHVHAFSHSDLQHVFADKKGLRIDSQAASGVGYSGEPMGWWTVSYIPDGKPINDIDMARKATWIRPYQSVGVGVIAKDAHFEIERMLKSLGNEPDKVIIGIDPATTDKQGLIARAERFPNVQCLEMPSTIAAPDMWGFSNARNFVCDKLKTDWVLWIDTDEELLSRSRLRRFLNSNIINSFVIRQHHMMIDNELAADRPSRLYRNGLGRFYGEIHEQIQLNGDMNAPIQPGLVMEDFDIINHGEYTEAIRREKAVGRNYDLLKKDVDLNVYQCENEGKPIRQLSIVVLMRDFVNRIKWAQENSQKRQPRDAMERTYPAIMAYWYKYFFDAEDSEYKRLAWAIVQDARKLLGVGLAFSFKCGKIEMGEITTAEEAGLVGGQVERIIKREAP